jgi:hypothetical protein
MSTRSSSPLFPLLLSPLPKIVSHPPRNGQLLLLLLLYFFFLILFQDINLFCRWIILDSKTDANHIILHNSPCVEKLDERKPPCHNPKEKDDEEEKNPLGHIYRPLHNLACSPIRPLSRHLFVIYPDKYPIFPLIRRASSAGKV